MLTDNYIISATVSDFMDAQSIPNLSDSVYLELAPKFDDYQSPFFVHNAKKIPEIASVEEVKDGINQIEYVEGKKLNLTEDQIASDIQTLNTEALKEYGEDLRSLSLSWSYEVAQDFSVIKINVPRPEEDLMWSDSALDSFLEFIESQIDFVGEVTEDNVNSILDLEKLWTEFHPENRWDLYNWKRDPQLALEDILDSIDLYANAVSADSLAYEIYVRHDRENL